MPRCSASGCRNMGSHTFPKDPKMRKLWEEATNKEDFTATKHSRLCSGHFKPSDYVDMCLSTGITPAHRILKGTAVPSIFPCQVQRNKTKRLFRKKGIEAESTRLTNINRILKKGIVPSIFPWSKTENKRRRPAEARDAKPRLVLKKDAVPSKFPWNEDINNMVHRRSKARYQRRLDQNIKKEHDLNCSKILSETKSELNLKCGNTDGADSLDESPAKKKQMKKDEIKAETIIPDDLPQEEENESTENNPRENNSTENNPTGNNKALRDRSVRLRNKKAYLANRRCSVPQCNTRPSNEISLHLCPNNAAVRNEWAEALRVGYQYVRTMVVCSLHFTKLDFIQSRHSERVLKHNAVPSRNLPKHKLVVQPRYRPMKKAAPYINVKSEKMINDDADKKKEVTKEVVERECRACLTKLDDKRSCCNVFQAWAPPWNGMEPTIAQDLAKLANVEISETDRHSKVLCEPCYHKLLDAALFASSVRSCDFILRMRYSTEIDMEKVWPKPIQIDKNINGSVYNNSMDLEIKQEIPSDDEYSASGPDNPYVEIELSNLDIKIEPEEIVEPPPMNITINGTISLDPLNSENKDLTNGTEPQEQQELLDINIKQEPISEGEQETELVPDLSLDCLLCTKSFNSVSGLKAHVIAQHSYKTVKRKSDGSDSPEKKRCDKYQCAICKRNFQTSTDLMVHETCHNKHVCYGCNEKFDSFDLLTRHRKRCKASIANSIQKLKTLEDVKRPLPEQKPESLQEIESKELETTIKDEDVEMNDLNHDPNNENNGETESNHEIEEEMGKEERLDSENEELDDYKSAKAGSKNVNKSGRNSVIVNENETQSDIVNEDDVKDIEVFDAESEGKMDTQCKVEDIDNNMKLHLEIHSNKSETESMNSEADMVVETLNNDDCT